MGTALALAAADGHFEGVSLHRKLVREGYELILGSKVDEDFGPVLIFGEGGSCCIPKRCPMPTCPGPR